MQKIDLAVWPRAELFRFFSAVSQPFYSVTFRVDVTNLHTYARAHGVSFYYALGMSLIQIRTSRPSYKCRTRWSPNK